MIPLPEAIRFGPDGLVPAIVQDVTDGTVLTLAYMNEEALELTRRTGYTHFWSRSRQTLWHKGETHVGALAQRLGRDADRDTIRCQGDRRLRAEGVGQRTR